MKLEKGMLISTDNWWYVVVEIVFYDNKVSLNCICDNANNRYTWDIKDIVAFISLDEIGKGDTYSRKDLPNDLRSRKIPYDVISAVLLGGQDDRFDDYE